mmetsp:Transcript_14345/g.21491  ORF Transcript_14345/g.21491 Transcript_14345/m.21491 type:complete len:575 (+) Transcript_14345:112-1836(+)|eukprot:CAMPEP_0185028660 /NCGR_PEP_ID=MMETSP1103-20130426/14548_1 /TAXON_ID=36769 /ORGANISM="Paraphysomonas bandaiensis, Strain Caron Lab Isolate" /LENGTH=574 /DNA_ID=CAMNT_0027563147 /DNA_START=45 /DNA_END=1769 /DNA_ORIENTATION=-
MSLFERNRKTVPQLSFADFTLDRRLGKGGYGTVFLAHRKSDGGAVAMKFFGYERHEPIKEDIEYEIWINKALEGVTGVAEMLGIFDDTDEGILCDVYKRKMHFNREYRYPVIVMEALVGDSLLYRIITQRDISEKYLVALFKSYMTALRDIHSRRLIHRDLKCDNVMLVSRDASSDLKIVDLGMMVRVGESDMYVDTHVAGTPGYHAPESLLRREYSFQTDIWQSGVVLYIMLVGRPPFDDVKAGISGRFNTTSELYQVAPRKALDLVKRMLTVDPTERITIEEVFEHPWMTEEPSSIPFTPEYHRGIKNLACYGTLQHAFLDYDIKRKSQHLLQEAPQIMSYGWMDEQLVEMKKRFVKSVFHIVESKDCDSATLSIDTKGIDYDIFSKIVADARVDIPDVRSFFGLFDINGDGVVDLKEFLLTILTMRHTNVGDSEPARLYFNLFDINNDGQLSSDEFMWMVACMIHDGRDFTGIARTAAEEAFKAMDVNRDMSIDYDEFQRFYNTLVSSASTNSSEALRFISGGSSLFASATESGGCAGLSVSDVEATLPLHEEQQDKKNTEPSKRSGCVIQ